MPFHDGRQSRLFAITILVAGIALLARWWRHDQLELSFTQSSQYALCGKVYTGDIADTGEAESDNCILINENKVEKLGSRGKVSQTCDPASCVLYNLPRDHVIAPGFQDSHGHVLELGWSRSAVNLVGARSRAEVVERIESYISSKPEILHDKTKWIQGHGWDQTRWTSSSFPLASDLNSTLLHGRKIILRRIDVHALWLSKAALDVIDFQGDVPGGLILRDKDGIPTGCLIDKAMDLAYKVIPSWTDNDRQQYLSVAAKELLSVGITSVGDAAVDLTSIAFYQKLDETGMLPFRIYGLLACPPDEGHCAEAAAKQNLPVIAEPFTKSRLTVRAVKLFADGALGSWGSAMHEEYTDKPGWQGLMLIKEDELNELVKYWHENGWSIATHCIGDRAQTSTLNAYEAIQNGKNKSLRFRIEHAQIVKQSDIQRFAELGVIASIQPTHCTSDMWYVEKRLGAKRAREMAYVWQDFAKANVSLALGSDFPVELPNPIHGIYAAVSRLDKDQKGPPFGDSLQSPNDGWYPNQKLTTAQALHGFTAGTAFAQFEEDISGSLQAGKVADFVILDHDFLSNHSMKRNRFLQTLYNTKVMATFIDGKLVWKRNSQ